MTLAEWYSRSKDRFREEGLSGLTESAYQLYLGALRRVPDGYGTHVLERNWDVLVILDACRPDMTTRMQSQFDFLDDGSTYSIASCSSEWMRKTFVEEYADVLSRTAYVTGNPFSAEYVDEELLAVLDEVWSYAWDDKVGTIRPRPLTDRAIATWRKQDLDRMIVHYMQPHHPFVTAPKLTNGFDDVTEFGNRGGHEGVWQRLRRGKQERDPVIDAYDENLRVVLEDIDEVLLRNLDADRVAISADHANALGEFRVWGHPPRVPVPAIRCIPWCVTSATDTREYESETERETGESKVEQRLRQLGYR